MVVEKRVASILAIAMVLIGFVVLMAGTAQAAFITPVGVTSVSEYTDGGGDPVVRLIDGSGLSENSSAGTHDNEDLALTMWMSDGAITNNVVSEEVYFDLGAELDLTGAWVWNHNQYHSPLGHPGGDLWKARGVDAFDIYVSSDTDPGTASWTFVVSTNLALASGTATEPAQWIPFTASDVRLVRFDIQSAHSGLAVLR